MQFNVYCILFAVYMWSIQFTSEIALQHNANLPFASNKAAEVSEQKLHYAQ